MAERVAFPYWVDVTKLFTVISHEVGTHILLQARFLELSGVARIMRSDRERTTRLIEALCNRINGELLIENHLPIENSVIQGISEHFRRETSILGNQWSDWIQGNISLESLITSSYENLGCRNGLHVIPEKQS